MTNVINMKHNFLPFLMALILAVPAFAQENSNYYIEGNISIAQERNGRSVWYLTNINSKGIDFEHKDTIKAYETNDGVKFDFEHVTTTHPKGFGCGLKFYRWQNSYNRWQIDSEVRAAEETFSQEKQMTVMLVLDCSGSIGANDFEKLKASAKQFVDTIYAKSHDGRVHVGVIGFNSMKSTKVLDIQPLQPSSLLEIHNFIDNLKLSNNTALYYAMDLGIKKMDSYVKTLHLNEMNYDGSYIVTFTDGYDNDSFDPQIGRSAEGVEHAYFKQVEKQINTKAIGGAAIESFIIAIRGNDVNQDNEDFEKVLSRLSSDKRNFYQLKNFNKLQGVFQMIATDLIDKWKSLTCYIPRGYEGRVRWTIDCSNHGEFFAGGHLFVGAFDSKLLLPVGFDLAYRLNDHFYVGGFADISIPFRNGGLAIGPMALYALPNRSGFMLGMGIRMGSKSKVDISEEPGYEWQRDFPAFVIRAGYKFKTPLYVMAEADLKTGFAIGVGYRFL